MRHARLLPSAVLAAVLALPIPAAAQDDRTLAVAAPWEVASLDPATTGYVLQRMQVAETLVDADATGRLVPGLATEWGPTDDPTVWEFKLREGVSFHDGSPFTADDVLCSFERAPDVPNSPSSFELYTEGKTVEKVDDHTVRISTEEPYPLMANDVSTISIVSDETGCDATTEAFNDGEAASGTGPWKFV